MSTYLVAYKRTPTGMVFHDQIKNVTFEKAVALIQSILSVDDKGKVLGEIIYVIKVQE
jgi:hypothetical protein